MTTKEKIRNKAIEMVRSDGLINLTRADLCAAAGVPDGSFSAIMGVDFGEFVAELADMGLEPPTLHAAVKRRANPALRKEHILRAAVELARERGYKHVTRDSIAAAAGVSVGLVSHYFATMKQLQRDIMRYAVQHGVAEIVAQGLALRDDHARKASPELKQRAAAFLTS